MEPLKLHELLDGDASVILTQSLGYSQTNGTEELRKTIAAIYSKASADNLLVTNGSSEAIFVCLWSFLKRGAEVVVMLPNYMQVWGLAKTMQAKVKPFWLREEAGQWAANLSALRKIVRKRTKLIAICNPNNPTGAVLDEEAVEGICEVAKQAGAWILSDEVYHGAELSGSETPTFWGKYDKIIVTNGLSKAYGLPGLRVGWALTSKELATKLWSYHDYTTIGPSALSDYIARKALQPEMRAKILGRTREILRSNLPILTSWVDKHHDYLSFIPPKAGAIAYLKYFLKINSTRLAERLLQEKSTLVVPGDQFGMDHYLRIGYGCERERLISGLGRVGDVLSTLDSLPKLSS
ncbi:MAG: aminotransferase class I/II-fold pyridoxal phosphate-dependent enzyme [Candidatus Bathyarchaeia archaeon]